MANNPFVASNGSSSGGTSTGGLTSRYCKDPRELPIFAIPEAQLLLKTGQGGSITCSAANSATFFGAMAFRGATVSIASANTYVTCANLLGRGRLYNVVAPTHDGGAHTPTIRLTIDGVTYTLAPTTTLNAAQRLILGPATPGVPVVSNSGTYQQADVLQPNQYSDAGFCLAMNAGCYSTNGNMGLVTPEWIECYDMPFLQFESSCVIEFKNSNLATATGDRAGGASYRMLPT